MGETTDADKVRTAYELANEAVDILCGAARKLQLTDVWQRAIGRGPDAAALVPFAAKNADRHLDEAIDAAMTAAAEIRGLADELEAQEGE